MTRWRLPRRAGCRPGYPFRRSGLLRSPRLPLRRGVHVELSGACDDPHDAEQAHAFGTCCRARRALGESMTPAAARRVQLGRPRGGLRSRGQIGLYDTQRLENACRISAFAPGADQVTAPVVGVARLAPRDLHAFRSGVQSDRTLCECVRDIGGRRVRHRDRDSPQPSRYGSNGSDMCSIALTDATASSVVSQSVGCSTNVAGG
jgi:hypothetical protein